VVTGRYDLSETTEDGILVLSDSTSLGMVVFRESFRKLRSRMGQNQKEKSTLQVTRWAIHDHAKFRDLVTSIKSLIDGLESVTSTLGVLEKQRARLIEEIESISDTQSLRLLQSISSVASSAVLQLVSDRASQQISFITSGSQTYHTAPSRAPELSTSSIRTRTGTINTRPVIQGLEIVEESHVPQNQRWIAALLGKHARQENTNEFEPASDNAYGQQLATYKEADEKVWVANSAKLLVHADGGMSLAQRMFTEVRSIRRANVPFISAAPVQDRLDRLLASVEGPPGTPYEGGIFWITVQLVLQKPPLLRFQTRIYHPNIDCTGNLCADYASWWTNADMSAHMWTQEDQSAPWFSELRANHYSLGALLVAICGLLSSPNVEDPLVPEIAENYIKNYTEYSETAKLYTGRYAKAGRPPEDNLRFMGSAETATLLSVPRISAEPSIMARRPASLLGQASIRKTPSIKDTSRYTSEQHPMAIDKNNAKNAPKSEPTSYAWEISRPRATNLPLLKNLLQWKQVILTSPNISKGLRESIPFRVDPLIEMLERVEKRHRYHASSLLPVPGGRGCTWLDECRSLYVSHTFLSTLVSKELPYRWDGWYPPSDLNLCRLPLATPQMFDWEHLSGDCFWARGCWKRLRRIMDGERMWQRKRGSGRIDVKSSASIEEMEYGFGLFCGYILYEERHSRRGIRRQKSGSYTDMGEGIDAFATDWEVRTQNLKGKARQLMGEARNLWEKRRSSPLVSDKTE